MTPDDEVWRSLVHRAEDPSDPWHIEILRAQAQLLNEQPDGCSYHDVARLAWSRITEKDRQEAFPWLLELYARTICTEANTKEREEHLDRAAADSATTYLERDDVQMLWDSVFSGDRESEDTECSRGSLTNVLSELELVQHRLAMHLGSKDGNRPIYMQAQDVALQLLEHRSKECAVCACPTWIEVEDGLCWKVFQRHHDCCPCKGKCSPEMTP